MAKIQEDFCRANSAASANVKEASRVEGQAVRTDWEFDVVDIYLLAKAHPNLVKIEPRVSDIKDALKLGIEVKGIRAKSVLKSTTRTTAMPKAIEAHSEIVL